MPRVNNWEREFDLDPQEEDLLRHVLTDNGEPPQGLHQGGYAYCIRHGDFYSGNAECPACKVEREDDAIADYYAAWEDDFYV
jgi:hypothetical protein